MIFVLKKAVNLVGNFEKIPECWAKIRSVAVKRFYQAFQIRLSKEQNDIYLELNEEILINSNNDFQGIKDKMRLCALYVNLCSRDPSILHNAINVHHLVKQFCIHEFDDLLYKIATITDFSAHSLLKMIGKHQTGSDRLVQYIVEKYVSRGDLPTHLIKKIQKKIKKTKNARFMATIMPCMSKDDVISNIGCLIRLELTELRKHITKICKIQNHNPKDNSKSSFMASDLMIALQQIKIMNLHVRKKLMEVIDYCIKELRDIFSPLVIACALEKLIHLKPLPFFYIRTIIQTLKIAGRDKPIFVKFALRCVEEMIKNQIWDHKSQWDGFRILINDLGEKSIPSILKMSRGGLKKLIANNKTMTKLVFDFVTNPENSKTIPLLTRKIIGDLRKN